MENPVKILVVEDEMIIGAKISLHLSTMGYEVTGIIPRGEEAILHVEKNLPDLVIMDIQLKGSLDGIETAHKIKAKFDIPIIFLTANSDNAHFNRARDTKPEAFISKPYKKLDLQRAIELTLSRLSDDVISDTDTQPFLLEDRIFVKYQDKRVKLYIKDILYFESERNYSKIYTSDKEFLLAVTLKKLEEKLPTDHFVRIHRSYIINISHIEAIADDHLVISKKVIPLSKSFKPQLLENLRMI